MFEDHLGLCASPAELVASITPAFPKRLRIVTADAKVGYCYELAECRVDGLVPYSAKGKFDPELVRRIEFVEGLPVLSMASGELLKVTARFAEGVRHCLGIDEYMPQAKALTRVFLREYPFEIARASAEVLRKHFDQPRLLVANLIWQALEYSRQGQLMGYGNTHRGFWYKPVWATLERAGFDDQQKNEALYQRQIAQMIDEDRLFDHRDLGFADSHPHRREIGARLPHVILVIEKDCVSEIGIAVARELGLSWFVTGGVARLAGVEFFCAALQKVHKGPVSVIDFGDFDPGGWVAGKTFVGHLARFGTACPAGPQFLVRPELFTQEELDLFSRPLSVKNERIDGWLEESGGINGKPRGIHCDWLHPQERVMEAVRGLLSKLPRPIGRG